MSSRRIRTHPVFPQWTPTLNGYVRFLAESQAVYDALEAAVQDPSQPACEFW